MVKYFCDVCGTEISEPYCLYTIGWALCSKCYPKFVKQYTVDNILVIPNKLDGLVCQSVRQSLLHRES